MAAPKKGRQRRRPEVQWQPVSGIPLVASLVDGGLSDAEQFLESLSEARHKPYVLDRPTLDRVTQTYSETTEWTVTYTEQLERWKKEPLTDFQTREIERLIGQVEKLRVVTVQILEFVEELRSGTIETVLEMSDLEMGIAVLEGRLKL